MKRRNYAGKIVLGIVIAVLAVAGLLYFGYVFFQAEEVEVLGNGKFTKIYIEGLAAIEPNTHMLKLDEEKIKEGIESKEPYLEVVSVKKHLPKTVVIEVKERQPKALIEYADNYYLVDSDANVLDIFTALPEEVYPVVNGFSISGAALGKQITTEDTFKITVFGEIITAMENRKMLKTISEIDLSDINSIKMTAANGTSIKFGQADHITDKIKWIDNMLPRLESGNTTAGVLDVSSGAFPIYKKDPSEMPSASPAPDSSAVPTDGIDGEAPLKDDADAASTDDPDAQPSEGEDDVVD